MTNVYDDFDFFIDCVVMVHDYTFKDGAFYDFSGKRRLFGLVYVIDGEIEYTFSSGNVTKVCQGDTFLLTPECAYTAKCIKKCRHFTINFTIDKESIQGKTARNIFENDSIILLDQPILSARAYFENLHKVWQRKDTGYRVLATSKLYELLFHFLKSTTPKEQRTIYAKIAPAKEYIDQNWTKEISVPYLASLCHLSTSYFRHLFIKAFRMSPTEYRNHLRVLHAKDMLLQGFYSVSEISYACGFDDPNYFSRFFKKETGISPKSFRFER